MATEPVNPLCLLGITGSIAAYKSVYLTRLLLAGGFDVQAIMTSAAKQFIGATTFSALTKRPTFQSLADSGPGEPHIEFGQRGACLIVAPATADCIARLSQGRANDAISATALAFEGPLLVAPAMHPSMWAHPATQENVRILRARGAVIVGPVRGEVASGDVGEGRMAEPEAIVEAIRLSLSTNTRPPGVEIPTPPHRHPQHIVVTAGPTVEDLDPVRFISNRSSGKMGFAIAEQAARRGAQVTLIAGPVELPTPPGVRRHNVRSAIEMQQALGQVATQSDAIIMAAAVGDFRATSIATSKLKRHSESCTLELVQNPDIIAGLGRSRGAATRPTLVAFAVETGSDEAICTLARAKLNKKQVDLVVANHAADALGKDSNRVHFVTQDGVHSLCRQPKSAVAIELLNWLERST